MNIDTTNIKDGLSTAMKFEVSENVVHAILVVVGILTLIYIFATCVTTNRMIGPWDGCVTQNNCYPAPR